MIPILFLLIIQIVSALPPLQIAEYLHWAGDIDHASKVSRRLAPQTPIAIGQSPLLPLIVNPESYVLRITPVLEGQAEGSLKEWTAPGYVEITVTTLIATDKMILHKDKGITVDRSTLEVVDGECKSIEIKDVQENAENQTYTVVYSSQLPANQVYTISMKFVTWITNISIGLNRLYYNERCEKHKPVAGTQFQWNDARRAFPCFDEPRFKSIFKISVGRKNGTGYHTLSNMKKKAVGVSDPELPAGWVYDHYEDTLPCPTYLVGIMVTDYAPQEAKKDLYSKPVTIYASKDAIGRAGARFVADASARCLAKFEELTLHPYELPKLESVGHPGTYFIGSGMENWGIIAYRLERIMYYHGETTILTKALTLDLIAHEVSHQWFGNVITCKYWSHLWTNEGTTTYMSFVVSELIYPEFEHRRLFLTLRMQPCMRVDVGLNDSILNLNVEINRIPQNFVLTYSKCASIMRMMEGVLGLDMLMKVFQEFFKQFAYKVVESDDLYKIFQDIAGSVLPSGKTFNDVLHTWISQPGFPMIRINGKTITQEPFMRKGVSPLGDFKWEVPLFVSTKSDPTPKIQWLHKESRSLCPEARADKEWTIFNHDGFGYYRVWYDDSTLRLIEQQLIDDNSKISGMSKSQLIDDYFNFANFGHTKITKALDILKYLVRGEYDYIVWFSIFQNLETSRRMLLNKDPKLFQGVFAPSIDKALKKVTWDQDKNATGTVVMYRAKLMDWACALESADCKTNAQDKFATWLNVNLSDVRSDLLPPDLQPILSCAIVGFLGQQGFDFMMKKFEAAGTGAAKFSYVKALCCTKDKDDVEKLISDSLDPNSEFAPFMQGLWQSLAANTDFTRFIFAKIQEDGIFQKMKSAPGGIAAFWEIFYVLCEYINEDTELTKITTFLKSHESDLNDPNKISTNYVLGRIKANVQWVKEHYDLFRLWLISQTDIGR